MSVCVSGVLWHFEGAACRASARGGVCVSSVEVVSRDSVKEMGQSGCVYGCGRVCGPKGTRIRLVLREVIANCAKAFVTGGGGGLKKKIRSLCEKKKRFRNSWRDHTRGVAKGGGGGGGRVARGFICARRKWILLAISSQIKIKCSGKLIWGVKLIFNKVFYSLGFIIINIINLIYIYRKY